jgi:hypothetical protein
MLSRKTERQKDRKTAWAHCPSANGFAIVSATVLLGIMLVFGLALLDYSLSSRRAGRGLQDSLSAEQIAEAGVNKAIYCLNASVGTNCGGTYGTGYAGETAVSYGGGTFTTTLAASGADKDITAVGTAGGGRTFTIKVMATSVPPTDSPDFSYALQSGGGGAHMENNSQISGTIYSNGDIDCQTTQARITGDAYSSKANGLIDSCDVDYHAHADRILDANVDGDAYYKNNPADIAGTTVDGTKYPNSTTPAVAPMPDLNLQFWRDSAEAGGIITGNHSPADNSTLGPVRITGDLIMNNNVDVTVNGPIWVNGNITTGNNSSFTLASSFGAFSTVILADNQTDMANKGKIDITNNTGIYGTGNPSSHILFASTNTSTNDAAPALSVANNASGAVFYAINGTLRLQSNSGAKSLAGYRLFIDQNAVVTYVESEFTGQFSNSPAGVWRVKEGTWRQAL